MTSQLTFNNNNNSDNEKVRKTHTQCGMRQNREIQVTGLEGPQLLFFFKNRSESFQK